MHRVSGQARSTLLAIVVLAACGAGCSKSDGGSNSSSPTSPTPPNPATPVSQTGCAATYVCPNTDAAGAPNPATPTFDRVTLSTGTSSSCRGDLYRNSQSPVLPFEFSIRNPAPNYSWRVRVDASLAATEPRFGSAQAAGPLQASVTFTPSGLPPLTSGMNFTQNLILEIYPSGGPGGSFGAPAVAACGVTVWGVVTPGK